MATINDKDSGQTVKISNQGSMLVTTGDDGYPTFFAQVYHPRLTVSLVANTCLWALRAPLTRTVIIRDGQIKLSCDTTPAVIAESGVDLVRFTVADPSGGVQLTPARMRTADASPQITSIRCASATNGLTMTGLTVEPTTQAFLHIS